MTELVIHVYLSLKNPINDKKDDTLCMQQKKI